MKICEADKKEIIKGLLLEMSIETLSRQNKGQNSDSIANNMVHSAVDKTKIIFEIMTDDK